MLKPVRYGLCARHVSTEGRDENSRNLKGRSSCVFRRGSVMLKLAELQLLDAMFLAL